MAVSRFSLLFLRRTLNSQFFGRQQQIRLATVVKERFYSAEAAPNASACSLDLLITNLTQESNLEGTEISTVMSVEGLRKVTLRFILNYLLIYVLYNLLSLNYFNCSQLINTTHTAPSRLVFSYSCRIDGTYYLTNLPLIRKYPYSILKSRLYNIVKLFCSSLVKFKCFLSRTLK